MPFFPVNFNEYLWGHVQWDLTICISLLCFVVSTALLVTAWLSQVPLPVSGLYNPFKIFSWRSQDPAEQQVLQYGGKWVQVQKENFKRIQNNLMALIRIQTLNHWFGVVCVWGGGWGGVQFYIILDRH